MILVTGVGCSGTAWAAAALTAAGVPCRHEHVFHPSRRRDHDRRIGESSWLAAPYADTLDVPVVLLVRDPLAVVQSTLQNGFLERVWRGYPTPPAAWAYEHQPDLAECGALIDRAVRWVARWDRHLWDRPHVRVEDGPEAVAAMCAHAGRPCRDPQAAVAAAGQPNSHRGRRFPPVTWDEIDATRDGRELRVKAERFGYL